MPRSATFANQCKDLQAEKQWVRSILDEWYLWDTEIVDVDPAAYSAPQPYYEALLVKTPSASGRPRDRFSTAFETSPPNAPQALWYGVRWQSPAPLEFVASYVRAGTPASAAGVKRGDRLVAIHGRSPGDLGLPATNAALFPVSADSPPDFTFADLSGATRTVTLTPVPFADPGVLLDSVLDRPGGPVGYLVFTSQLGDPVGDTSAAVQRFLAAGVTDLILDLRYNPGGSLQTVAAVGTLIGGAHVAAQPFAFFNGNDKYRQARAAAGLAPEEVVPFGTTQATLSLGRVFILTTAATCSASESLINGLTPFLDVRQVGSTTCGKPYGFTLASNCGTTYEFVAYENFNAQHQGSFADGLSPGCPADDDLSHALGDPSEGMLVAALAVRETGHCPPRSSAAAPSTAVRAGAESFP